MAKKDKDPNAPKKPMTAYFMFAGDVREEVKGEHPDAKVTEIARIIGAKWSAMSDEEKKPFQERAEKDKIRYQKEKAAYDKKHNK